MAILCIHILHNSNNNLKSLFVIFYFDRLSLLLQGVSIATLDGPEYFVRKFFRKLQ
jgi:hypothetical protein